VALEALPAVARAVFAVRRALPLAPEEDRLVVVLALLALRLAVVFALLAVRRALALVADAARRVSLRFRVAAAFWPLVLGVSAMGF
jgi:hypothetical protein